MSQFIGNLSKNVELRDLEKRFNAFGRCRIDKRVGFAFVEFDDEYNAEDAREEQNNENLGGLNINIEWSKRSGRYNPRETRISKKRSRSRSGSRGRGDKEKRGGNKHDESESDQGYRHRRKLRSRDRDMKKRERDRLSPDYHQRESWSYSFTMSPKRPPKKHKKEHVDKSDRSRSRSRNRDRHLDTKDTEANKQKWADAEVKSEGVIEKEEGEV